MTESSKDTQYFQFDQLPPFNFTLLFNDEYGYASYQRLLGVRLVSDGLIYSTQDMYTEETITYLAADLTPLMLLTLSSFYQVGYGDKAALAERTPADAERLRSMAALLHFCEIRSLQSLGWDLVTPVNRSKKLPRARTARKDRRRLLAPPKALPVRGALPCRLYPEAVS